MRLAHRGTQAGADTLHLGEGDRAMSKAQPRERLGPSESMFERVDHTCDAFQAAWRHGPRPRIEEYLRSVTGQERSKLLEELLKLELELLAEEREVPFQNRYQERFPNDRETVRAVFAEATLEAKARASRALKPTDAAHSHEVFVDGGRTLASEAKATIYPIGMGVSPPPDPAAASPDVSTTGP